MKDKSDSKTFLMIYKTQGKFYNTYGIDAYIMNYFFNYKVLNDNKSGFPDNTINKVIEKLEGEKISYQIIYKDKDPLLKDFKKLNRYNLLIDSIKKEVELKKRFEILIDKIKKLDESKFLEVIECIEKCIE